jgi:hypothetical protein
MCRGKLANCVLQADWTAGIVHAGVGSASTRAVCFLLLTAEELFWCSVCFGFVGFILA